MNNYTIHSLPNNDYTAPNIEIYEFATERGFAQSDLPDIGDGGDLN